MPRQDRTNCGETQAAERVGARRPRQEVARLHAGCRALQNRGCSQQDAAKAHLVPRTTVRHWDKRRAGIAAHPEVVAFFESPVGAAFLHQIVVALHLVFTFEGPASARLVGRFLEQSGLAAFVASSHGSQDKVSNAMSREIVAFEEQHQPVLAEQMEPKKITVCKDETFHPAVCLVAMEPDSGFILVEEYSEKRDAAAWGAAMSRGLSNLPVQVIQSTSDEGKGILAYVRGQLGAHHSPDLFHVQQDLQRATSVAFASRVAEAEKAVENAEAQIAALRGKQEDWTQTSHGPGRPPNFDKRIAEAEKGHRNAEEALAVARARQETVQRLVREIGELYHPFDMTTGAPRSPSEVAEALTKHLDHIRRLAGEAGLSDYSKRLIAKARKMVPKMQETLAFFARESRSRIAGLGLSESEAQYVLEHLVAAAYLRRAASKASDADSRERLRQKADEILGRPPECISRATAEALRRWDKLNRVVDECVALFQRSSSCVEGRNGQLSLRHHSLHSLSQDKLRALTIVHNYLIRRRDGTTAAERFFGTKPPDLFQWLLDRLDMPARPAARRRHVVDRPSMPRAA